VLRTGSFLLNDDQSESWQDLPQATQAETATRLLSTVEDSAYQVARTCTEPKTIVNVTLNIGQFISYRLFTWSGPVASLFHSIHYFIPG